MKPITAFAAAALVAGCLLATVPPHPQDPPAKPAAGIPDCKEMQKTASGLEYGVLRAGSKGESPGREDTVVVHYTGWLTDGTKFDSSRDRGEPFRTRVADVVKGWTEALQLMTPGAQYKLVIPPQLGYGEQANGPIPANSTLVFEVELLEVVRMPKLRPANAEAQKALASGVRYEVVAPGTGPAATARHALAFRYAVFRADGTLIECTEQTGQRIAGSLASLPYAFLKEIAVGCRQGDVLRVEVPKKEVPQAPTDTVWELELVGLSALPEVPQFRLPDAAKVVTTQSGLKYEVIEPGTGSSPTAADSVVAHYTGWLTDGKVFDSSHERGSPSTFPLRRVIPGWTEGLQLMKTGGKFLFEIPGPLAYGAAGQPPMIPANCTLVFLVELIEVKSAKAR